MAVIMPGMSGLEAFAAMLISDEAPIMTGGNRTRAAGLLGLSRPTLHAKIEKCGIKISTSVNDGSPGNRQP